MKTQIHARVLCGTILAFVFSATCWAEYEDYVRHVSTDTTSTPSFSDNAAGKWQTNGVAEAEWPCAGKKFYVQGDVGVRNVLYTSNITVKADAKLTLTFAGDELVLAHNGRLQPLLKRADYAASNAFLRIPLLTILPGGDIYNANGSAAGVEGVCNVKGTSSNPSVWYVYVPSGNSFAYCNLDFVGESSSVFYFRDQGKNAASYETCFMYGGDASRFFGTIRVKDPYARLVDNTATGMSFPGTLSLSGDAMFRIRGGRTSTIANLQGGGIIDLAYSNGSSGRLVVTNSFTGGDAPVPLRFSHEFSADAETIALVTFENGASESLSDETFDLSIEGASMSETALVGSPYAWKPNVTFTVTNAADGLSRTLAASHRKFVWLDMPDGSEDGSCFLAANASHWSDDSEISPENDYYISSKGAYAPSGKASFSGHSLSVCGPSALNFRGSSELTVPDFRWIPNSGTSGYQIQCWNGSSTVSGKVTIIDVPGNTFRIQMWNGTASDDRRFTIAAELAGFGTLNLTSLATSASDTRARYALTGLNTNFSGRVHVTHAAFGGANAATYEAAPDTYCVTVLISDSRNLGGPLAAFDHEAIVLGNHSLLKVAGSPVFDDPTRGWSIKDVGRIHVEAGQTVTMTNMQITYSGEFRKEGDGTLRLGGTARFTEAASETPLAGTNVLSIAGGAIMPMDTTCCDGLAVKFAAGTKLLLDASVTGDLKSYGLYDVKWNSPIAVADGAALPVELVLPEGFDTQSCHQFGICTISPTAAASMGVDDFAVAHVKGMRSKVSRVENLDASDNVVSVTFACNLVPAGFTMTIR